MMATSVAAQSTDSLQPTTVTFAAVGDIMMGTTFPEDSNYLPEDDGRHMLFEVAPELRSADITFGNLEGCYIDGGTPAKKCQDPKSCYVFRSPEHYLSYLDEAGFDVFNLANNHARDFGPEGLNRTRALLDSLGKVYTGPIGDVASLEVNGLRVVVLGFAPYQKLYDLLDIGTAAVMVAGFSTIYDLVIVSFHGGGEGPAFLHVPDSMEIAYGEERGHLRAFAHAVVDAGADLVIGHGPHIPRAVEYYHGRLIAYSLGNFATYEMFNMEGVRELTFILKAELAADGSLVSGRIVSCYQQYPGIPRLDPKGRIIPLLQKISRDDFGPTAAPIADDGTIIVPDKN
ncbi:MAG TPA: CapA family protein [candidate division Zixibacteria bacterium]|nr:CapA family protein [candidate division Zixibacteria bacterium]